LARGGGVSVRVPFGEILWFAKILRMQKMLKSKDSVFAKMHTAQCTHAQEHYNNSLKESFEKK